MFVHQISMPKGLYVRTEEHRQAMSEARKGKPHPVVKPRTQEHCDAISRGKTGKKYSEAQRIARDRLTAQWKAEGYWPTKGWSPTEETRDKIRQAQLGVVPSKLKRHGITTEQYLEQKASGNSWCWFGKHFVPSDTVDEKGIKVCFECKPKAQRASDLKKNYGVTPEWYEATLAEQNQKCAICGCSDPRAVRVSKFMVDHAHDKTKRVRGLLCHPCNLALGIVEQTPSWTALAQAYLDKHQCSTTTP